MKNKMEGFLNKAKKMVGAAMLASAASVGVEGVANAETPAGKSANKAEQVQKVEIDESKITESGKLFRDIVKSILEEAKEVKTKEDADWLLRARFGSFISEYYIPSKVNLQEGAYGTTTRKYSNEDLKLILVQAGEMKKVLEELNAKLGVDAFETYLQKISDLITKLEDRTSLAGQKRAEILERYQ